MLKVLGVIPARFASTRFPGKPLVDIAGKSMIERVYIQATKSKSISEVFVATDDDRIFNHVKSFGGNVMMTNENHQSGTDRCAEVLEKINNPFDVVVNIQGDEPFISPTDIDLAVELFNNQQTEIATLIKRIIDVDDISNPNVVKVVIDKTGKALLFSRSAIPFARNISAQEAIAKQLYNKHIGLYAYRSEALNKIAKLNMSSLEKIESLEQLRWLENGFSIYTATTNSVSYAIDSPEDLEKIKLLINSGKLK